MSDKRWDGRKSFHGYRDQSVHGALPGQSANQRGRGDERTPDLIERVEAYLEEQGREGVAPDD